MTHINFLNPNYKNYYKLYNFKIKFNLSYTEQNLKARATKIIFLNIL
jgi:hypothetical protein